MQHDPGEIMTLPPAAENVRKGAPIPKVAYPMIRETGDHAAHAILTSILSWLPI